MTTGGASIALLLALTSVAMAQRELRPPFPAEKFSPRPVQPAMRELPVRVSPSANEGSPADPAAFEQEQKRRWDERSRDPAQRTK